MSKVIVGVRTIRNVIVTIVSVGWLIPIHGFLNELLGWFYDSHQVDYKKTVDCGFRIELSLFFLSIAMVWLGVVIAFWIFVVANKFWPIKQQKGKLKI